jgi:hypothetical protein
LTLNLRERIAVFETRSCGSAICVFW